MQDSPALADEFLRRLSRLEHQQSGMLTLLRSIFSLMKTVYSENQLVPFLRVISGDPQDIGKCIDLTEDPVILGRGEAALSLTDRYVSQAHAIIRRHCDSIDYTIEDHDSANKTYVQGTQIETPHLLQPADQIRVGMTVIEYNFRVEADAEQPVEAPAKHSTLVLTPSVEERISEPAVSELQELDEPEPQPKRADIESNRPSPPKAQASEEKPPTVTTLPESPEQKVEGIETPPVGGTEPTPEPREKSPPPPSFSPTPVIRVDIYGDTDPSVFSLKPAVTTIGSGQNDNVRISNDKHVKERHADIIREEGKFVLFSRNDYVQIHRGNKVDKGQSFELTEYQVIWIGDTAIEFDPNPISGGTEK